MSKTFIAHRFQNMTPAPLSKTNDMVKRYDDVIDLSIGDPDYPVDGGIINAMNGGAMEGYTRYTEFLGDEDLRRETAKWYKEDWDVDVAMDEIMITSGGTHAMFLTLCGILNDGDEVIVTAPYYVYYTLQISLPKGKLVVYNTNADRNFDIEIDELRKVITPKTKAIILNSPCNPSGKVYSPDTIRDVLGLAEEYDFAVIADDIYGALNYTENNKPICAYEKKPDKVITVYSYSKDYSMTGFRLGHIIASNEVITAARNINEAVSFTTCAMVQRAGIYALKNRRRIQKELSEEYKRRMDYIAGRISKMNNITCGEVQGTFYLFPDIRKTGMTSMDIWEKILDEAHVLILPGSGFGQAGEGYIRIACTVGIDVLSEAMDRLASMDIFKFR